MNCKKIEELLSLYLEGNLSGEDKKIVQKHLDSCPECFSLFHYLKETTKALREFPQIEMSEELKNRLYEIPQPKKKFRVSFDLLLRPSLQPLLAAATVFLILVSAYLFNPKKNLINRTIDRQLHLGYSKVETLYVKTESLAYSLTHSVAAQKDKILVAVQNIDPFKELKLEK